MTPARHGIQDPGMLYILWQATDYIRPIVGRKIKPANDRGSEYGIFYALDTSAYSSEHGLSAPFDMDCPYGSPLITTLSLWQGHAQNFHYNSPDICP